MVGGLFAKIVLKLLYIFDQLDELKVFTTIFPNKCFAFTDEMKGKERTGTIGMLLLLSISILIFHLPDSMGSFR